MEERDLGHHQRAGLPKHLQGRFPNGDGHHVLHHHQTENLVLHGESYSPDRAHLISLRAGVLPSGRGWRESDAGYQHSPLVGRVSVTGQQDSATDVSGASADRQIPAVHFHHEHGQHPRHGDHHQLELPRAEDAPNATADQENIPQVSADDLADEETEENAPQVDDGDPERHAADVHLFRKPDRVAETFASLVDQVEDGSDGAVGSSSSELQDQQEGSPHH